MNYYNKIVKLNLQKYKKSYISFIIIIILACTFTVSVTIFNDSLIKTEEQQRKDIYGSWHISVYNTDDTLYKELLNHGTLKNVGKMTVYGSVLGGDSKATGTIGSVDDNMVRSGLSLMDGRFPEKDNEIAVELDDLSMGGYSYEIGQAIHLKIQVYNNESKKMQEIQKTYILTGILKNYSSIWKTEGNQLVSFFVTDTSLAVPPVYENIFGTLKEAFVKNADELEYLTADRGNFVKNDYTYYEYVLKNKTPNEVFLSGFILVLLVTITSALFIFHIFYTSLKEHNKNFVVMRCLGASKYQISELYFKELIVVLAAAFTAGIIFGFFVSFVGYKILKYYINGEFIFYLNFVKLVYMILILMVFVFLFAVSAVMRIRKMSLTGNVILQPENRIHYQRRRKLKPLTVRHMVRIFNNAHRKETVVYFLLSLGAFLALASTSYRSYQKYSEYSTIMNTYSEDYDYGIISSYYETQTHIGEEEAEEISKIYGIDYIRAYRCSDYLPLTWKGMEKSEYAEYLKNSFFSKYAGEAAVHATVYSISDEAGDYKIYLDEMDQGNISAQEFLKGNEVILYLPAFYRTQDGRMLSHINKINPLFLPAYNVITEDTVGTGDEMVIKGERGNVTVKVAGVIYEFDNNNSQFFLTKPYSVICNNVLYDRLVSGDTYEYLQIYANKNANFERTDVEISKMVDEFYFQNFRILKENAKYDVLVSAVISLGISFLIFFIIATVQYNNLTAKMESDYGRNHILAILGMDKLKIQFIYLYNILINCMLCVIIGFIAIYLYQLMLYVNKFKDLVKSVGILNLGRDVFKVYFATLPWTFICVFTLIYLMLNLLIAFYPLKKYNILKFKKMSH
ncbi:MAG: ABC transporter permease [Anaerocolumna sp.]